MNLVDMFPDQVDDYLEEARGVVLPIGSVEQHGPALLLGCDGYIASTIAETAAEHSGLLLLPMFPFSWIGGLRVWPGTIDVRPMVMGEYLLTICLSLIKNGFTNIALVNCHGGGREMVYSISQRVFQETGISVLTMYPTTLRRQFPEIDNAWTENGIEFDYSFSETSELCGALLSAGQNDLCEKVIKANSEAFIQYDGYSSAVEPLYIENIFKMGEVGYDCLPENAHVHPCEHVYPLAGLAALKCAGVKIGVTLRGAIKQAKEKSEMAY